MGADQGIGPAAEILAPTERRPLVDDVVARLRQAILAGHFEPGQPLREDHLASLLDVSRGPVRQALSQLQREGLVLIRHHRGATVARLSRSDVGEVYSLRLALERLAVQFSIRRATSADFEAMEETLSQVASGVRRSMSNQEAADLDLRFHNLIFTAARHSRLHDNWSVLQPSIYLFLLSLKSSSPEVPRITVNSHAMLLDALRARDEEPAVRILEKHLRDSYQMVMRIYAPEEPDEGLPHLIS